MTLEIDPQFIARLNAIGVRALENNRELGALVKELSGVLSRGLDDESATRLLDRYMDETDGEGHPQGLFGWFADAVNRLEVLSDRETGTWAPRRAEPGSLAAPKITILVEYNHTNYPALEVPELELALPLYLEDGGYWNVSSYPEGGASNEQRHELIGLALALLASPAFGFEHIVRAYHDIWQRHDGTASTEACSAPLHE